MLVQVDHLSRHKKAKFSVIYWPHPALFRRRPLLSTRAHTVMVSEWPLRVKGRWLERPRGHCILETSDQAVPIYFDRAREGVIRENLALNSLSFDAVGNLQGLEGALSTLTPLFDDDRNRCNWRLYCLFARLACWKDANPAQALGRILTTVWKRPDDKLPNQLSFLASIEAFKKWHARCKSRYTVIRLKRRIELAQSLCGGQSSSGKDTANAERARSNRPRPPSTRSQLQTRRKKLARRSLRRAQRSGFSVRNRVRTLWDRFWQDLNNTEVDSKGSSLKESRRPAHPSRTRHMGRSRFRCLVSRRTIPCESRRFRRRLTRRFSRRLSLRKLK